MTEAEKRSAAKEFATYWKGKGYEKGESQKYWLSLLSKVYGVKDPEQFIFFEDQVMLDHTSFIDGSIPATHVLIEQKSVEKDLRKPIRQSDGSFLNPFQQAKRYSADLPYSMRPRWIVTCNFREFLVYDMEKPSGEPETLLLENLEKESNRLNFLVDTGDESIKKEMEVSIQAGSLVGVLYDALLHQYRDPQNPETLKSLNMLCVRLVFCLYAEDAGIFGKHGQFHHYLNRFEARDIRHALIELFRVLDTVPEKRDPYLESDLAAFPYVNGGLFSDENIEIPQLTEHIKNLLIHNASEDFNWSEISPTIFGAVFESTLNPETRRSGGMHYTSIENIHKVIDPLFLDDLKEELESIQSITIDRTRQGRLKEFQTKLADLTFLDPACGSGNFLTETYLCLRRMENEVIRCLLDLRKGSKATEGQIMFGDARINPILVSIGQFYGIEINDFAVTVARTALWIAEAQMLGETEQVVHLNLDFLPLKTYDNIHEANALRLDWESVVPKHRLHYIMGNPPFVGHQWRSESQAEDMLIAFRDLLKHGKLDYVCGWYSKAADYMQDSRITTAFVSTNSITQGESVGILWSYLFNKKSIHIQFAYRTFVWSSEAKDKAAVHCVIIGFACNKDNQQKTLYDYGKVQHVEHINGYLLSAPDMFIQSRGQPLTIGMPEMSKGSQPTDGGNLLLSEEDYKEMITAYPLSQEFIRRYISSDDYINNKYRYCLWLKDVEPSAYRRIPTIMRRLEQVVQCRNQSPTITVRNDAVRPMLFTQIRQPSTRYLAVPEVSSERRRYIPIGFLEPAVIASNKLYIIPNATIYMFGILISNVHMAWTRIVCGRLKSDYSYSPAVYNNFPWPTPTPEQKAKIEQTAQAILDARLLYPESSLADLYDEVTMPPELRKAHQNNDRAVMQAYGFDVKMSEPECVAALMTLYQQLVAKAK